MAHFLVFLVRNSKADYSSLSLVLLQALHAPCVEFFSKMEVAPPAATNSAPRMHLSPEQKSILKEMISFWFWEDRANLQDIVGLARQCLGDDGDETRRLFLEDKKEFSWREYPEVCSYMRALNDLIPQTADLFVFTSNHRRKIEFQGDNIWTIHVVCNWSLRSVLQQLTTLPIPATKLLFAPPDQSVLDLFTTEMNLCQQHVREQQQQQQQQDRSDLPPSIHPRNIFSDVLWLFIDERQSSINFTSFFKALAKQCVNLKTLLWFCNRSFDHEVPMEDTWAGGLLPLTDRLRTLQIFSMRTLTPIVAQFLRESELLDKLELGICPNCTVHDEQMMQLCEALEKNKSVTSFHLSRRGDDGDDALEAAHTNRLIRVFREGLNTTVKKYTGICKIEIQYWCTMNQVKGILRQDGATAMDVVESLCQYMSDDAVLYGILRYRPELWCVAPNVKVSTRKRRQSQA